MNKFKDDLSYCRKNSELLVIWGIIYIAMAILLATSFGSGLLYILFSISVGLLIVTVLSFLTINYLYYKKKMKNVNPLIVIYSLVNRPIKL